MNCVKTAKEMGIHQSSVIYRFGKIKTETGLDARKFWDLVMLLMPKTNPRRIPRTQSDVDKAYSNGIVEGLNRGIDLMLYVLIDKHDASMDDVQQLAGELKHAAQCVAEGYVTWADIRQMLKEYGVETALE